MFVLKLHEIVSVPPTAGLQIVLLHGNQGCGKTTCVQILSRCIDLKYYQKWKLVTVDSSLLTLSNIKLTQFILRDKTASHRCSSE